MESIRVSGNLTNTGPEQIGVNTIIHALRRTECYLTI